MVDGVMRILYVITKADEIGGAQVHVRDLSTKIKNDGHDVLVVTGEYGALTDQLKSLDIQFKVVPSIVRDIKLLLDIKSIIKLILITLDFKPDLIGLHSSKAGILGRISSLFTRTPVVFTAHGWAFADGVSEKKKKFYIKIEKLFSRFAKKIITVSQQDKDLALKLGVACNDKQVVIHNGVNANTRSFPTNIVAKDGSKPIEMIMVARFSEQKDHETLLDALAKIKDYNWNLSLVGKGPKLEFIKNLTADLGLNDRVSFLGQRDDVDSLLRKSDLFLLISNWEGYPLSILEAMREGLPIIASDVGGVKEAVQDNRNGYLIPYKNSTILANRMVSMINDSQSRLDFIENNKTDFLERHTTERMYEKTMNLYVSLL
ncbi:glycosyltransferase family 4 protein [Vibrio cyclitrophicus]|uniref:glycosyltransferase family 4 protein n=1 Tax=Vibrio cyclitrophicus TaxID=47951 RepID=UPI001F517176|nr:glycosyltransferase family 4 protein [Vibrio cyclitrophicus]